MGEGEKPAENPQPMLGEIADMKMTLKIWDVPPDLGRQFIGRAKSSYANKSWLLLQDLMMKADRYDFMVGSGRLTELEGKVKEIEGRMNLFESTIRQAAEETGAEAEAEQPKTFGKGD